MPAESCTSELARTTLTLMNLVSGAMLAVPCLGSLGRAVNGCCALTSRQVPLLESSPPESRSALPLITGQFEIQPLELTLFYRWLKNKRKARNLFWGT